MKHSTIIIFFALAMLKTQAQNYLISFAGSGDATVVGTVKVDNLTTGNSVTLNGGDILHLTGGAGIETPDVYNEAIKITPNPMAEQTVLTFVSPEDGNAVIYIVDLSGKTVYQISSWLSPGTHSFRISGINQGMYIVKVTGNNYFYTTKLISQVNLQGKAGIEYVSSDKNTASNQLKNMATTIDMPYTDANQLLFKGISGIYSTMVSDVPASSKTITFNFAACTDEDNNHYSIVQIGTQTWMAENLNVGFRINGSLEQTNNGSIEKYCYENEVNHCDTYGGLYQWNEMMKWSTTPGARGICPTGWHIPRDAEWTTLTTFLGGESVAGGKMKSTGTIEAGTGLWLSPNTGTNEGGFTAVPAGYRFSHGPFGYIGYVDRLWSSSEGNSDFAWTQELGNDVNSLIKTLYSKGSGLSVRCLKNY